MGSAGVLTSKDSWRGGHYGIEIDLGLPSEERLAAAVEVLWSRPFVEGCYLNRNLEPTSQMRVDPRHHTNEGHLYGTATLPRGASVPCGSCVCRLENEAEVLTRDLVSFYIALGSLHKIYPVEGYPFSDVARAAEWKRPLDAWLVETGPFVYERFRFRIALVGFEVDFPKVTAEAVEREGVPSDRYEGFLVESSDHLECIRRQISS
jgi:hypothetical protein